MSKLSSFGEAKKRQDVHTLYTGQSISQPVLVSGTHIKSSGTRTTTPYTSSATSHTKIPMLGAEASPSADCPCIPPSCETNKGGIARTGCGMVSVISGSKDSLSPGRSPSPCFRHKCAACWSLGNTVIFEDGEDLPARDLRVVDKHTQRYIR
jgi:hypothetical protein